MTSSLNSPLASVQVIRIFASVGISVGGVYDAALTTSSAIIMTPTSAPIPASVGVPSLISLGMVVSLMPFSCISLSKLL